MLFKTDCFDLVVSLGAACSCTDTLRMSGLQRFSYPFDWLFGSDFEGRVNLVCNDFNHFIEKDDLIVEGTRQSPMPCTIYRNTKNGLVFNHDFPLNSSLDDAYVSVSEQYRRRIFRLLSQIEQSERVLFVYIETPNCNDKLENNDIILKAQKKLSEKFQGTEIYILYISNKERKNIINLSENSLKCDWSYTNPSKDLPPYMPDYESLKKLFQTVSLSNRFASIKENDLISVLIPAYNHEKYIQESIKSVLDQTYKNIELIVIDDGSTDSTWNKITEMKELCEKKLHRVLFLTRENKGVCETLNELLANACGKYIAFLASDDRYRPNALEVLHNFLAQNRDYALAVGNNGIIDENGQQVFYDADGKNTVIQEETAFKTLSEYLQKITHIDFKSERFGLYEEFRNHNYVPNGYLIRKNIFKRTGYYTKKAPLDDWYIFLQISKYSKMKYVDEVLLDYRNHSGNTMKDKPKIINMTKQTYDYENELIKTLDLSSVLPSVRELISNLLNNKPALKTKTIFELPYILKVWKVKTETTKRVFIRLLGMKIRIFKKKNQTSCEK